MRDGGKRSVPSLALLSKPFLGDDLSHLEVGVPLFFWSRVLPGFPLYADQRVGLHRCQALGFLQSGDRASDAAVALGDEEGADEETKTGGGEGKGRPTEA